MQAGYGGSCSYLLPALGKQSRRLSEFAAAWSTEQKFQDSQDYLERPSLKKQKANRLTGDTGEASRLALLSE